MSRLNSPFSRFDYDVITGPAEPRSTRGPLQDNSFRPNAPRHERMRPIPPDAAKPAEPGDTAVERRSEVDAERSGDAVSDQGHSGR